MIRDDVNKKVCHPIALSSRCLFAYIALNLGTDFTVSKIVRMTIASAMFGFFTLYFKISSTGA